MHSIESEIKIPLINYKGVFLCIYGDRANTLKVLQPEWAAERGESPYQLLEGSFYNYYFEKDGMQYNDLQIEENVVVKQSLRRNVSEGRIATNIYVGSLPLVICNREEDKAVKETVYLEVIPTKINTEDERQEDPDYRSNYEFMLGEIAEKSTELLLQIESPVYQNFEVDFESDAQTIYQRFAFVKSLLNSDEFLEAIQKVISLPTSKWTTETEKTDILKVRRFGSRVVRQLTSGSNRIKLSQKIGALDSVPQRIESYRKVETYDTHENRFIKYALQTFLQFIRECERVFGKNNYEKSRSEAAALADLLENELQRTFFNHISRPTVLKLNSPALQRKSGYREILNAWLKFDLSLRLIWRGGDDVYKAGKRDIAVLYEYWLFFKLYDLMIEKFELNQITHEERKYDHLIDVTRDGLQLIVKSGTFTALECKYKHDNWEFNVRFSYNKTFKASRDYSKKEEGSWTKPLRPDYTLSIWPSSLSCKDAEKKEQIVHIHFDSKYKVQQFVVPDKIEENEKDIDDLSGESDSIDSLTAEKKSELKGIYKNADLMKMHAYKDAIRRTAGAYILYPGSENPEPMRGFHEIIPGLGAFALRPQKSDDGIEALSNFIDKVIDNFKNASSHQKKTAINTYETYIEKPSELNAPMPYYIVPEKANVIICYYKSSKHYDWIKEKGLYNFRVGSVRGSLPVTIDVVTSKYLLLHKRNHENSSELWRITSDKFEIYSKEELQSKNYPNPRNDNYLVVQVERLEDKEFQSVNWSFRELPPYMEKGNSSIPFTTTLKELMENCD
jgi:predicted component of viral defense system (DUF524 family)